MMRTSSRVQTRRRHLRTLISLLLLCATAPMSHSQSPHTSQEFIFTTAPFASCTRIHHRRTPQRRSPRRMVRRNPRERTRRSHLGLAPHRRQLVGSLRTRSRTQHRLLEPSPLPLRRRQTLALLQIRTQRPHLDRRPPRQHRRSPHMVAARTSPRRPTRPHQRQAARPRRRHDRKRHVRRKLLLLGRMDRSQHRQRQHMDEDRPHHRTLPTATITTHPDRTRLRNHPAHHRPSRQQTSSPLRSLHLRHRPHLRSRLIRQRPHLDPSPPNRPPQPQLRHRRRRPPRRPHRPHLQQHHHRPNSAQSRRQHRRRALQNLRNSRRPTRRVLLSRHHSRQSRRTRHHLHLEPQTHSLRHRTLSQRAQPGCPMIPEGYRGVRHQLKNDTTPSSPTQ